MWGVPSLQTRDGVHHIWPVRRLHYTQPTALCNTPDLNRNVEPLDRSAEEVIKEESELTCQYLEPSSFYVSNITNLREEAGGRTH